MEYGFGTGILTGMRTDVSGVQMPVWFGALQGVNLEMAGDTKELYAMNQYPEDTARGKTKITGKAKVAQIKGKMYNELFFARTMTAGQRKFAYNESTTLGSGSPSYTVANASSPLTDQGVFLATDRGIQFSPISSGPGSGQYTFNPSTGVYAFGTDAAGLGMLFSYTYTVTTGFKVAVDNPIMGTTPRFRVTLMQQSAHSTKQIVLFLWACVSSRLSFPTSIDDYSIQDLDFSAFADDSGQVLEWSTAD
jgi:hypothetical protein